MDKETDLEKFKRLFDSLNIGYHVMEFSSCNGKVTALGIYINSIYNNAMHGSLNIIFDIGGKFLYFCPIGR